MRLSYDQSVNMSPEKMKGWIARECGCELTQASQATNDIVSDRHKATPFKCSVGGQSRDVLHVSAGIAGTPKTCSIFYVEYPEDVCHVVALGKHVGSASYSIKYKKDCWTHGNTVDLEE
jgi:arabinogalactan endo-1,4-beta-galactosidase